MNAFERAGWFRLPLPDGWEASEEEDGTLYINRAGGDGEMRLSVRAAPRPPKAGPRVDPYLLLRAFTAQTGVDFELASPRRWTLEPLEWASCEWTTEEPEGAAAWRAWMATNQDVLAFATYACPEGARDRERGAVDLLLGGLLLF